MWVEPCCVDRILPSLLKTSASGSAKGGFAFFTTNGDITFAKFAAAISSLAGSGHRMTLVIPEVDVMLLREIKRYFDRQWTAELNLLTQTNQEQMVSEELQGYMGRVTYAADPMVIDGLLCFEPIGGDTHGDSPRVTSATVTQGTVPSVSPSVIIQGAMLREVDFSFSLYAGYYGTDAGIIDGALKPIRSKLKLRNRKDKETN